MHLRRQRGDTIFVTSPGSVKRRKLASQKIKLMDPGEAKNPEKHGTENFARPTLKVPRKPTPGLTRNDSIGLGTLSKEALQINPSEVTLLQPIGTKKN
jgi:hypothetical protein